MYSSFECYEVSESPLLLYRPHRCEQYKIVEIVLILILASISLELYAEVTHLNLKSLSTSMSIIEYFNVVRILISLDFDTSPSQNLEVGRQTNNIINRLWLFLVPFQSEICKIVAISMNAKCKMMSPNRFECKIGHLTQFSMK